MIVSTICEIRELSPFNAAASAINWRQCVPDHAGRLWICPKTRVDELARGAWNARLLAARVVSSPPLKYRNLKPACPSQDQTLSFF